MIKKIEKLIWSFIVPLFGLLLIVYWQHLNCSISILPRYGSILIIIGIFIDGQLLIRDKDGELTLNSTMLTIPDEKSLEKYRTLKYRFTLLKPGSGLLLIIMGTFIWGFGDLLIKC